MKRLIVVLMLFFGALFVVSCSFPSDPQSGVTHGSNFLRGAVVGPTGEPIVGSDVTVRQIRLTRGGQYVVEERTSITDEAGSFYFENMLNGRHIVLARNNDVSAITSRVYLSDDEVTIPAVVVNRTVNISGRVLSQDLEPVEGVSVFIAGTNLYGLTDSDGVYTIENAMMGEFELLFFRDSLFNVVSVSTTGNALDEIFYVKDIALRTTASEDTQSIYESDELAVLNVPVVYEQEPEWYVGKNFNNFSYHIYNQQDGIFQTIDRYGNRVYLLEDFENILSNHIENRLKFAQYWYVYNDTANQGNSVILPENVQNDISRAISYNNAFSGRNFGVEFHLDPNPVEYNLAYAAAGFRLRGQYSDFSNFRYISFYARGEGVVRVEFVSQFIIDHQENWAHFGYVIELDDAWRRVVIYPEDIVAQAGSLPESEGVVWDDVRGQIISVDFRSMMEPGSIIRLQLDDVYMSGLEP